MPARLVIQGQNVCSIYDNLEKLLLISQIARSGSVRRAAQELRTSQTAILRSLNIVEDCLQARLFNRSSSGIEITPVGLEVLAFAERLKNDVAQLCARVRDFTEKKTEVLPIAVAESVPIKTLSHVLGTIQQCFPSAETSIRTRSSEALFAGLLQDHFHLAVTDVYNDDVRLQRDLLHTDRFAFFGRIERGDGRKQRDLKLVTSGNVMIAPNVTLREHLARMGLLSLLKCETPGFELALAMAESGSAIAVLPRIMMRSSGPLDDVQEIIDTERGLQEFGEYRIFLYASREKAKDLRLSDSLSMFPIKGPIQNRSAQSSEIFVS